MDLVIVLGVVVVLAIPTATVVLILRAAGRRRRKVENGEIALTTRTNVLSIVSFIGAFFIGLVGLVAGYIALSQIKRTNERGWGFAVAAITIGYFSVVASAVTTIIVISVTASQYH